MNNAVKIMPCLDMQNGRVAKGVHFVNIKDAGDPVECAKAYCAAGADELAMLDITATVEGRATMLDVVKRVAEVVTVPFTIGGGIASVEQAVKVIEAGADKVSTSAGEGVAALAPEPGTPEDTTGRVKEALAGIGSVDIVAEDALDAIAALALGSASFLAEALQGMEEGAVARRSSAPHSACIRASDRTGHGFASAPSFRFSRGPQRPGGLSGGHHHRGARHP